MTHDDRAPGDDVAGDSAMEAESQFAEPLTVLADLVFLRPDSYDSPDSVVDAMPARTWDRIDAALAAESRARIIDEPVAASVAATDAEAVAEVVSIDAAPSRHRNTYRWAGGLVAASLAVVIGGVVITAMRTTTTADSGGVVAAVAFSTEQTAAAGSAADSAAQPSAAAGDSVAIAEAAPAPSAMSASDASSPAIATKIGGPGWVQPARLVLASGTDYTPTGLGSQVTNLLDGAGVDNADEARAMPVRASLAAVGTQGFTASIGALRECITALTASSQSQALVVDRATYQGNDAGVVVAPTYDEPAAASATSPAPTTTIDSDMGELDVWVVNPDCSVVDPSVMLHVLHHWAS